MIELPRPLSNRFRTGQLARFRRVRLRLALLLLCVSGAFACPCWVPPLCGHFAKSDVVFVGTLLEDTIATDLEGVTAERTPVRRVIRVDEVWKGLSVSAVGAELDVSHIAVEEMLQPDEKVIVFANLQDGAFETPYCYAIYREASHGEFAAKVRAWKAGQLAPWIEGMIFEPASLHQRDEAPTTSPTRPAQALDIILASDTMQYRLKTNEGNIEQAGIRPGVYQLSIDDPLLGLNLAPDPIDLRDNPCDSFLEFAEFQGSIEGKLETADGAPVAQVLVQAECVTGTAAAGGAGADGENRAGGAKQAVAGTAIAYSKDDGSFLLSGLPPCTYRIHLQPGGPSAETPYHERFLPGGTSPGTASTYLITGRDSIDLGTMQLDAAVATKTLRLTATLPDGSPAIGATLCGRERNPSRESGAEEPDGFCKSTTDGVFEIPLIPEHAYTFELTWTRYGDPGDGDAADGAESYLRYGATLKFPPNSVPDSLAFRFDSRMRQQ